MSAHFVMLRDFSRRDIYSRRSAYPGYIWAVDGCAASTEACRWLSSLLALALSLAGFASGFACQPEDGETPAVIPCITQTKAEARAELETLPGVTPEWIERRLAGLPR